ncbi:MAG: YXWGXW repeat-containing protein [Candidatus Zixiibacteriota bacterium]
MSGPYRLLKRVAISLGCLIALSGCAVRTVYVTTPPPARKSEVRPAKPFASAVWIRGHWTWRGGRHVWISGHWAKARSGQVWVPGHWVKKGKRGWVWKKGHWRRG